jgi:hypothetical protein
MELRPEQNTRLHFAIRNLRRTPEFGFLRQLIISESAKSEPDFPGLKAHMLEVIGQNVQQEIEGAVEMRVKEIARP